MPPKYVQRVARLPEVFALLAAHPNGLALTDLGARLGAPAEELRADLLAFFTADLGGLLGLSRPHVLEFVGPDGRDEDPNRAEIVRIVDERPSEELGVEYVDAVSLALVYASATALLEVEPANEDLAGALDVLAETLFGETLEHSRTWNGPLVALQEAARDRRRVRIVYSRSWYLGVTDRVIEPYLLVQTRRGWEVDAGPPDADGRLRTFLLSNFREFEVIEETFGAPADLAARLEKQRATRTVVVRIPHAARWAADMYAEQVRVNEEDELTVTLELDLLEPVERRVGLLLLAAGPDASVVSPGQMIRAVSEIAGALLAHHRGS